MNRAGCGALIGVAAVLTGLVAFANMFNKNGGGAAMTFFICAGIVVWIVLAFRRDKAARAKFLADNAAILDNIQKLPQLPVVTPNGLALNAGEICYHQVQAIALTPRTTYVQKGGFGGVSVPISGLGMAVTVGQYKGKMTPVTETQSLGLGTLYITNARIVFIATHQTIVLYLGDVVNIEMFEDGFQVRSANAPLWSFQTGNVRAAALAYRAFNG